MARSWVTVEAARTTAGAKYERNFAEWAVGQGSVGQSAAGQGSADQWSVEQGSALVDIPLHPPTESAALADQAAAIAWVKSWRDAGLVESVLWTTRRWASLGSQEVPERVRLAGAAAIAGFARKSPHWRRIEARTRALLSSFTPGPEVIAAVRRNSRAVAALTEVDFERLLLVLQWLAANPDSGLYIRQLPVRGVDTKWVSKHRVLVERLFTAISGRDSLGLSAPPVQVRLRFLDPSLSPGGLGDVSAPVSELAALNIEPRTVFVFENLESVVAMPPVPGAVVIHGSGYAVDRLGGIPWVRHGRVIYWGDLDSHGFGILNRVRASCSDVSVVLMDLATLAAYADLWVAEPTPNTGDLSHLIPAELDVLAELKRHGNIRLEQERIEWAYALQRLLACARAAD